MLKRSVFFLSHPFFFLPPDFEINGARLTLQPTTPGFKKTNGNGQHLCSGPHVEVNGDGVCSPKIEVLGVGDRQIRLVRKRIKQDMYTIYSLTCPFSIPRLPIVTRGRLLS